MNLWETLLRPDKEELENSDRRVIADAANILEVGEFQLLQLAYWDWCGEDLPEEMIDRLFQSFMIGGVAPPWARHYARKIAQEEQSGRLDYNQPGYHRYDCDFNVGTPFNVRSICFVLGLVAIMIGGGIVISNFEAGANVSMFPPYLSDADLQPRSKM